MLFQSKPCELPFTIPVLTKSFYHSRGCECDSFTVKWLSFAQFASRTLFPKGALASKGTDTHQLTTSRPWLYSYQKDHFLLKFLLCRKYLMYTHTYIYIIICIYIIFAVFQYFAARKGVPVCSGALVAMALSCTAVSCDEWREKLGAAKTACEEKHSGSCGRNVINCSCLLRHLSWPIMVDHGRSPATLRRCSSSMQR